MEIIYTAEFIRLFKKLPLELKKEAVEKEILFKKDTFDVRLKTHKLKGKLSGCWAFFISYSHRIIFEFNKEGVVYFHSVGSHDIYK